MDQEDGRLGEVVVVALVAECVDPRQIGSSRNVLSIYVQLVLQKVVVANAWWRRRDRKKLALHWLRRVDVVDGFGIERVGREAFELEIREDAAIQQNIRDAQQCLRHIDAPSSISLDRPQPEGVARNRCIST
jgi:hypothetical protein